MNLNFPLILLVLTALTGLIALLDRFVWAPKRGDQKEPGWIEQSKSFFPVLALVFVLRSFVAEPFEIPSSSMEPGLIEGDYILVSKFHYGLRWPVLGDVMIPVQQPKRGDVMVFFPPDDPRYFIKRVIGLPGDHVVFKNRQLTINGEAVPIDVLGGEPKYRPTKVLAQETFDDQTADVQWMVGRSNATGEAIVWAGPEGEWTVPEGHYFTMGDNRGNSADSRSWGMVPDDHIVGKAVAVWAHWKSWSTLPSFSRNRWM